MNVSRRMYKTRLKQWNLKKNRKAEDMVFCREVIAQRKHEDPDKITEVSIGGKIFSSDHVQDYCTRHRANLPSFETLPISADVYIYTPVASLRDLGPTHSRTQPATGSQRQRKLARSDATALQRDVTASGSRLQFILPKPTRVHRALADKEPSRLALKFVMLYFQHYSKKPDWQPWHHDAVCRDGFLDDSVQSPYQRNSPTRLVGYLNATTKVVEDGCTQKAKRLLDKIFFDLSRLLPEQHPQLVASILLKLQILQLGPWGGTRATFLERLVQTVNASLEPNHPLRAVLVALAWSPIQQELLDLAFDRIVGFYERLGGKQHPQYFDARFCRTWCLLQQGRLLEAHSGYVTLLKDYERLNLHFANTRVSQAFLGLANVDIALGEHRRAEDVLHILEPKASFGPKPNLELVAECQRLKIALQGTAHQLRPVQENSQLWKTKLPSEHPVSILGGSSSDVLSDRRLEREVRANPLSFPHTRLTVAGLP